jgi:hypothetical protein
LHLAQAEPLLHRADLELTFAHVFEIFRRAEEHVDECADERRDQSEDRRGRDEPRILDPPPRVLVHPEPDRQPEHDEEEDREVADDEPRPRVEEIVDVRERRAGRGEDHRISFPIM